MLRKLYLIPAVRLHGSSPPRTKREQVKKREHVKKRTRDPYEEEVKKRKRHRYEEWLKMRQKMDEADIRKKAETTAFAEFLNRVMPTGQPVIISLRLS